MTWFLPNDLWHQESSLCLSKMVATQNPPKLMHFWLHILAPPLHVFFGLSSIDSTKPPGQDPMMVHESPIKIAKIHPKKKLWPKFFLCSLFLLLSCTPSPPPWPWTSSSPAPRRPLPRRSPPPPRPSRALPRRPRRRRRRRPRRWAPWQQWLAWRCGRGTAARSGMGIWWGDRRKMDGFGWIWWGWWNIVYILVLYTIVLWCVMYCYIIL